MTDDEAKKIVAEADPWYRRTWIGRVVVGAGVTAAGALTVWAASVLFSAATVERRVQANTEDVSKVQRTLNEKVVPTLESIDTQTDHIEQDIDRLSGEVDRVEKRQYDGEK